MDTVEVKPETNIDLSQAKTISLAELKEARRQYMKTAIQQELQNLIALAAQYRKNIDTAKTDYKKKYYQKKMTKLNEDVRRMVVALQRLQTPELEIEEPEAKNDIDPSESPEQATT